MFETHTEVEANKKAQAGVSWTAMVAKSSCGEGVEKGSANLQKAIQRKDVIVRNDVYYEPTHILEIAGLHSSGVEGPSAVHLEGTEMQSALDKFWATAQDH